MVTGILSIVGGALQTAAGATLGVTVGWTGIGAIAAGFLIANGLAIAAAYILVTTGQYVQSSSYTY